jgi:lipoprotein NlpI
LQSGATLEKAAPSSASKNAAAFHKSGDDYRGKGDYDRAITEYSEAIRLDPNYAMAFNARGIAYRAKRDYDRAIADYDQAIRLNPNNATFFNNRGNAYRDKGEHDRAIQEYNEAIRLNPNYALAFTNRGVTYGRKLDYERAIADYDQAIKLDPKNAGAFNSRGNAHRNKRNYQSALADYETAARIDPKLAQHRPMGITLYYLGRMAESAIALERRLKTAPQDAYAIVWRYLSVAKDQGQQTALRDLAENASKLENRLWPAPVVDFYLGKIDQKAMFAAANNPDAKKTAEQICEANFYAGEAALLKSSIEEAIPLLRLAERDCPKTFYESHGASVELGRVGH